MFSSAVSGRHGTKKQKYHEDLKFEDRAYPKWYSSQQAIVDAFIRSFTMYKKKKMTYSSPLVTVINMENSTVKTDVHSEVQVFPDPWISNVILWQALTFDEFT